MKIYNSLFENKQYFETIGKIHESDQLSVMDAYRINRLVKKLNELNEEYMELKKGLLEKFGTPSEEQEGVFTIEGNQRILFTEEMNNLVSIEHDLETEILPWPKKLEDGFSATDLNIMELFFNLDEMVEPKEKETAPEIN
jgi:hypothetical protein